MSASDTPTFESAVRQAAIEVRALLNATEDHQAEAETLIADELRPVLAATERAAGELADAVRELDKILPGNGPTAHPSVRMVREKLRAWGERRKG